ncbi:hypothetical protein SEA_SKOG_39 [Gordonia phage Skog]|uniref:Uncharacterized protein n=1 Tax=Gordonia phage Skog TaxID=2704033 RepID=A0A6G6XJA7_9CAUD|nr:hypothetical protein KHQ85_gp039 [Gordonia phage Skog]QIG58191.1 hypothetical protein SEA_SKOG_39 [Gordonia phage Skog]
MMADKRSARERVDNVIQLMRTPVRTIPAQTKLTEQESADLDDLVQFFQTHGVPNASRSSVVRATLLDTIRAWKDEVREHKVPMPTPEFKVGDLVRINDLAYTQEPLRVVYVDTKRGHAELICRNGRSAGIYLLSGLVPYDRKETKQ